MESRMRKLSPYSTWSEEPGMQNLSPDLQEMLAAKRNPLQDVFCEHADIYVRWRYIHEGVSAQFDTGEIERALTVLIDTYENR